MRIYLCTGSDNAYVKGVSKASKLNEYFHGILTSESLDLWKGTKEYWRKAIRLTKRKPQNCLAIDNSLAFLRTAKMAGCSTVLVNREREPLSGDFTPDFEVHDLSQLPTNVETYIRQEAKTF